MLSSKKYYRGRRGEAHGTTPWRLAYVLLTLILFFQVMNVRGAVQIASGTVHLSNTLPIGDTAYSVDYSYPSTAQVGKNLTIMVTLHVISLTGQIDYIAQYRLLADIYVGTQLVQNGSIISDPKAPHLYSGASWGPNNLTLPITADNAGLARGTSANATVSITMVDRVYHVPRGIEDIYEYEPAMQAQLGSLLIQNGVASSSTSAGGQGDNQTYLPYALVASGAVLMILAFVLPRGPRPS